MVDRTAESGSFRDPSGQVFLRDGRVYRTVMSAAVDDFIFVRESGLFESLIADDWLVAFDEVDQSPLDDLAEVPALVLEHPRLAFISYPYEWPFSALKAAALHHLKVHLRALEYGVTLSDASAYNIQFQGAKPIFIDHLSFVRYREGDLWNGHRQFCAQFLNPLLLRSLLGVPHNSWYRGEQEGIPTDFLSKILPFRKKLSLNILMHVVLPTRFQRNFSDSSSAKEIGTAARAALPLAALRRMLEKLMAWIERLAPPEGRTEWSDYAEKNSYGEQAAEMKRKFIESFVSEAKPEMVWDLGCNTGDYSVAALNAGATHAVGFDFDQGAIERGFHRAEQEGINYLTLFFDAANPTPQQGWSQKERKGMIERGPADAVFALALVHHLAIACNVPLPQVMEWLTTLGKSGIVEFVPKSDPMVERLLRLREDIFPHYDENHFLKALERYADILSIAEVPGGGRKLVRFRTKVDSE